MKKHLLTKVMLLLCALVAGSSSVWADEVVLQLGSTPQGTSLSGTLVGGKIEWALGKGSGSDTPNYSGANTGRIYSGNTITISAASSATNLKIKGIVLTATSSGYLKTWTASDGGTVSTSDKNATWTGNESSITLTNSASGQARIQTVTITYEETAAYVITPTTSDAAMGTVALSGAKITASPKPGYRVKSGDAGYTVTAGTVTVVNNGDNTFTVTPTSACTVQINFEAIPTHKVNYYVNGVKTSVDVAEGADIDLSRTVTAPVGYYFVGWLGQSLATAQDEMPELAEDETMGDSDIDYYAVFAKKTEGDIKVTFDAADISNLTAGASLTWTDKVYGLELKLVGSGSSRYTSGTPNTFTVGAGSSKYMQITAADMKLTKVVVYYTKDSNKTYKVQNVSTGATISSDDTENLIQTITFTADLESVQLKAGSNQVRATKVIVDAEGATYSGFCTTITAIPAVVNETYSWATFSCDKALDFTGTDVEAYIVTGVNGTSIVKQRVYKVPANTGLLVTGTTDDIPVTTAATDDVDGNLLVAGTGEEVVPGSGTTYVLSADASNNAVFKTVGTYHPTVPVGKAYLVVPSASRDFFFVDGDATGIETIGTATTTATRKVVKNGRVVIETGNGAYTLNGARVE